jgi:hypothetical protein
MAGSNLPSSAGAAPYFYLQIEADSVSETWFLPFCLFEALGDGCSPKG